MPINRDEDDGSPQGEERILDDSRLIDLDDDGVAVVDVSLKPPPAKRTDKHASKVVTAVSKAIVPGVGEVVLLLSDDGATMGQGRIQGGEDGTPRARLHFADIDLAVERVVILDSVVPKHQASILHKSGPDKDDIARPPDFVTWPISLVSSTFVNRGLA